MTGSKEIFYPESRFGGFTDIDGWIVFFNRVNALLDPSFVVLNVGCGRGAWHGDPVSLRRDLGLLKGKVAKVIGIDVDLDAQENPCVDEFHLIKDDVWEVDDDSIDMIVCDNVVEHIDDPDAFFSEVRRVLKDGGYCCIRTSNRWSYISLAAILIPNSFHSKVTSAVQDNRKEADVFPTRFRCNSRGKLRRAMKKIGLDCVVYGYEAEPSYLAFSKIAYFFGVVHQRFAPGFLKPALFAFGKIKKS